MSMSCQLDSFNVIAIKIQTTWLHVTEKSRAQLFVRVIILATTKLKILNPN